MNNLEIAKQCRNVILSTFSQCGAYSWSTEFICKEIKSVTDRIRQSTWFIEIDLNSFTQADLEDLGFVRFDDKGLMCIPLWITPFCRDSFCGGCINGEYKEYKLSKIDNDVRFGCIAYGVLPKE
jgi:hypothetical protein